ncbi:hypothetical protein F441_21687 [Phytophthora nicotianae CJ01A1]|uniref:Uncharacterized protein n=5 Tax=Phytophthora nicotianae TaxID=4792 RepID=V9DYT6_PHYNI|nr:hypothetical protein F443_21806 [Phytophthora nicotianae P1569]ETK71588.1 hypothetical protein L915_21200 [Phytophthora nicotianae]ETO59910.1 hypothetical protein F444_21828 [Phytophthora nicotianae P1976]ETP01007.1 hypothetical protein F441_21687 [Phytophthora nicotianae CJ01A1]ETP29149.1 hypothetical protein F442_21666 [Phytophthora nicotianae P10297]
MAQGMSNIGQSWATTPNRYFVPMTGTTGATNVIPGISSAGLPTDMAGGVDEGSVTRAEVEQVALFTNPQGVYKTFSGTWDPPPGHVWNGKYWYEPRKIARKALVPR